jgi:hypothetical protein
MWMVFYDSHKWFCHSSLLCSWLQKLELMKRLLVDNTKMMRPQLQVGGADRRD